MHPFYGPNSQILSAGSYWWIGLASMAMYLIFWAVVMVIALKVFRRYFLQADIFKNKRDDALSILRERYAKGEIDAEEYHNKKEDLEK